MPLESFQARPSVYCTMPVKYLVALPRKEISSESMTCRPDDSICRSTASEGSGRLE